MCVCIYIYMCLFNNFSKVEDKLQFWKFQDKQIMQKFWGNLFERNFKLLIVRDYAPAQT